jgi:hypothetical protein
MIATSYTALDGSLVKPSYTFGDDPDTGFFRDTATGNMVAVRNGVAIATFTAAGVADQTPVVVAAPSQTLTAAMAGATLIGVVDAAFILPLAADMPGKAFTFITGAVSGGTGLTITRAGADTINMKTFPGNATGVTVAITAATVVTNAGASDVVWDMVTLVSDGVNRWIAVSQVGIWA